MPPQRHSGQHNAQHHNASPYSTASPRTSNSRKVESRRGPWSPQEDKQLKDLVILHGAGNWVAIQNGIFSRSAKQCRERWHQNLDPKLTHDPITEAEGEQINQLVYQMGKRWADIARHLNGRSDNAVKNWWNGGENRRKREQARLEASLYPRPQHPTEAQGYFHAPHPQGHWTQAQATYPAQQQTVSYPPQQSPTYQPAPYPGPQLAPIVSPIGLGQLRPELPAPLRIPVHHVPRDIPSPAGSLPSMITDDPASPRSYTRRDSVSVSTPIANPSQYISESMVRTTSGSSSRSDSSSGTAARPDLTKLPFRSVPPSTGATAPPTQLPGINAWFAPGAPAPRELGHLLNPVSPVQQPQQHSHNQIRLPPFATYPAGH